MKTVALPQSTTEAVKTSTEPECPRVRETSVQREQRESEQRLREALKLLRQGQLCD